MPRREDLSLKTLLLSLDPVPSDRNLSFRDFGFVKRRHHLQLQGVSSLSATGLGAEARHPPALLRAPQRGWREPATRGPKPCPGISGAKVITVKLPPHRTATRKGKCETRRGANLTQASARVAAVSFCPGLPALRIGAGRTESARLPPRPAAGGAPGRPTYLRVPTARPPAAAVAAAATGGRDSRAPGPFWPPPSLGVRSPTWAAKPGHISAEGRQRPTPRRPGRRRGGSPPRLGPAALAARGAPIGRAPGEEVPGPRPTLVPLVSGAGLQGEGRVPAISSP